MAWLAFRESGSCACNMMECLTVVTHLPTSGLVVDQSMFIAAGIRFQRPASVASLLNSETFSSFLLSSKLRVNSPQCSVPPYKYPIWTFCSHSLYTLFIIAKVFGICALLIISSVSKLCPSFNSYLNIVYEISLGCHNYIYSPCSLILPSSLYF